MSVYLTAHNVDSIKLDAYQQQYKNGTWNTIKNWAETIDGTNAWFG